MNYAYEMDRPLARQALASERATFIRRTYLHVAGAIFVFLALETLLLNLIPRTALDSMLGRGRSPMMALLVVGGFIGISMLARYWAFNGTSQGMAYAGLGLYTVAEALIFLPLMHLVVNYIQDRTILPTAGILTLCLVGGLTAAAFITRKDFSFLGPIISVCSFLALGVIVIAILFPASLNLGLWFSLAMIALASASILYDTSNIIHHFRTDQYVGAALTLFASIATLFYYIIIALVQSRE